MTHALTFLIPQAISSSSGPIATTSGLTSTFHSSPLTSV